MKTAEKLVRQKLAIPPCRCGHGHAAHTYGEGRDRLALGPCNACSCGFWSPLWHQKYPALASGR